MIKAERRDFQLERQPGLPSPSNQCNEKYELSSHAEKRVTSSSYPCNQWLNRALRKSFTASKCIWHKLSVLALSIIAATLTTSCTVERTESRSPLLQYVEKSDISYSWRLVQQVTVNGAEIIELRLYSQTWQDQLWKHRLYLIKPARLTIESQALLTLVGGRWNEAFDQSDGPLPLPETSGLFAQISEQIGSVHVILAQVPFQPLFDRNEDELIAYTFDRYLATQDPEWPLLLPMVKSAVRAMDASQEAAREIWGVELDNFTLLGGSKRGWTAWLTAAADHRVTAVAPMVIDALNMAAHFPHQTEVWGAPSVEIRPYTERNLDTALSTEFGRELREIVDPFEYRNLLLQPKLIVNATNDAYFPVDSINLYWDELEGPKYTLLLPNQGHDADDFGRLIPSLRSLHRHAAGLDQMPQLDWQYKQSPQGVRICISADTRPERVRVWTAVSSDRDFRNDIWRMSEISVSSTIIAYDHHQESQAYTSLFAEIIFASAAGDYALSTTPVVIGPSESELDIFSAVSTANACDSVLNPSTSRN